LLHVNADGALLQKINLLDVMYTNDLERYLVKDNPPEGAPTPPGRKTSCT
jgi:hypothetical protein